MGNSLANIYIYICLCVCVILEWLPIVIQSVFL